MGFGGMKGLAMRSWIYAAAAAVLALAGCGQASAPGAGSGASSGAGGVFPDLFGASYRADGVIQRPGGDGAQQLPVVQIRSGKLARMEFSDPASGMQTATIVNSDTHEAFTLTNIGGRQMAMRLDMSQAGAISPEANFNPASVTRVGPCSGAGESGTEWTSTDAEGHVSNTCVTSDGIMLRSTRDGQVYWETTRVQRGPQDPALFTLPPGVQVLDLSAAAGQMAGQMQQLREKMGQ
jgi:hypothetical protein